MKLHFLLLLLGANTIYADNFSISRTNPTFTHSRELQNYITLINNYKPETLALKKRLQQTIAYYKKVHILKTVTQKNYTVDCIPFAEQPTLIDNPNLGEALVPTVRGSTQNNWPSLKKMAKSFDFNPTIQCPLGGVALLRPSKTTLTSERANKKTAPGKITNYWHSGYSYELGADTNNNLVSILTEANQAYFKGPQNQSVVSTNSVDHSLDQFWFTNNTYQQAIPTYSVEFGIIASAYFTNPASTSIFVFASVDNYGNNSCYNIECSNFIQFPNTPVLGSPTDTNIDYVFQVTHTTLNQYLNTPAYYLTLVTHSSSQSSSVLLGYYADSIYPSQNDLPKYFSAGAEVFALDPNNSTKMYGNYMTPYVGYNGDLHIEFSTENHNSFPYYTTNGPSPYGLIWHLGQTSPS